MFIKRTLIGSIAACIIPNMMFETPTDRGGGNQQQQQQQQQPPDDDFVSPFADIDRDLLDDAARAKIDKAEAEMRTMHGRVKAGATIQAERDQLLQQVQNQQHQQQQQQRQQPRETPPTFEEEMEQIYIAEGMAPDQAKRIASMNGKVFSKHSEHLQMQMGQHLAPVVGQVFDNTARESFELATASDPLGRFQIPEVAEAVWQQTQNLARSGQMVSQEFVDNLASIHWARYVANNPQALTQQQPQPALGVMPPVPITRPPVQQQQQTRFSYPGSGRTTTVPIQQVSNNATQLDDDTRAALGQTFQSWPVKPKEFKGTTNNRGTITRG